MMTPTDRPTHNITTPPHHCSHVEKKLCSQWEALFAKSSLCGSNPPKPCDFLGRATLIHHFFAQNPEPLTLADRTSVHTRLSQVGHMTRHDSLSLSTTSHSAREKGRRWDHPLGTTHTVDDAVVGQGLLSLVQHL
jgi:hypothetical protein